jgi:hypothetical protein
MSFMYIIFCQKCHDVIGNCELYSLYILYSFTLFVMSFDYAIPKSATSHLQKMKLMDETAPHKYTVSRYDFLDYSS